MGEIADMMLDGTMCAGCGEWMNDGEDGNGYPEYCSSCQAQERRDTADLQKQMDRIANKVCAATIKCIEKEMDAVFSPAILPHFQAQIFGLTRKIFLNGNGAISHEGMQKVVDNNAKAMAKSQKKKTKQQAA